MTKLDEDAQAVLDILAAANQPPLETQTPQAARAAMEASRPFLWPDIPPIQIRDVAAPAPHGPIPLRIYRPVRADSGKLLAGLIFMHGGGWVLGDLESHDAMCADFASRAEICVIAIDYRLAPEHKFPSPVEDCIFAAEWIASNAEILGIDDARLAVGGDSAGGNLAAVAALHFRESAIVRLRAQILLYPTTDMEMAQDSFRRNGEGFMLTSSMMHWFRDLYLSEGDNRRDWRVSPLYAEDLTDVAPAYILTCGFDPLCDEGRAYADRLVRSGVSVTQHHYANQLHGFLSWAKVVRSARPAIEEIAEHLRRLLG